MSVSTTQQNQNNYTNSDMALISPHLSSSAAQSPPIQLGVMASGSGH